MFSCHSDRVPRPSLCQDSHIERTNPFPSFLSLSSHLRSNVIPRLPFSIEDAQHKIHRNAQELESLQAAMHVLETEQSTLTRYVRESTSLLSPIRKLPVELLGQIFNMHCTRGTGNIIGEKSYCPAFELSQVCYFWREVMLSRAELWGNLEVRLEQLSGASLELLRRFLDNSKSSALYLRVTSGYWISSASYTTTAWEALVLLLQNSHRWLSATLRLDYQLFLGASKKIAESLEGDTTLSQQHRPFARLEHLDVSWFDCRITSAYNDREPIHLFENVPSLRSLTIPHYDDCFVFPLSQLQELNLTNVHRSPAPILDQTTSLKRLTINNFAIRDPGLLSHPQVSHITHLKIQVSSYFQSLTLKHLLDHLELPSLTSFSVSEPFHRYTDRQTWSQSAFVSLLKRSRCQLRKLGIYEILVAGDELVEILGMCPELEEFAFFEWQSKCATRRVLDGLGLSESSTASKENAPRLSRFAMRVDGSMVGEVTRVLESRAGSAFPLEEMILQGVDIVENLVDYRALRAHGSEGDPEAGACAPQA
ncbi:hypothetical protein AAF712_008719 [Marasmius tenuissimus]|uniref:F-box domain-containing protein n=1 Tax=Marasmius tenuissimus TaxID=585030 RepID=A0ABR2ZRH0_9AGAR